MDIFDDLSTEQDQPNNEGEHVGDSIINEQSHNMNQNLTMDQTDSSTNPIEDGMAIEDHSNIDSLSSYDDPLMFSDQAQFEPFQTFRNEHLAGDEHPETGVPFESKTITTENGRDIEGVFPQFASNFDVSLPENQYTHSDWEHISYANEHMYESLQQNTNHSFSNTELESLKQGETPEGYTWHHSEEPGVLQLVDEEIHANTGHTGGRSLWGGGEEARS
ncbi:hypothetical protein ABID56_002572 [Alkalibacillus flavidus]|uniref:HNH endonuclease n=1 Tax=Alkalibacillus flavidus TaxID=546021 RepID=A0ABV2L0H3_9BACI